MKDIFKTKVFKIIGISIMFVVVSCYVLVDLDILELKVFEHWDFSKGYSEEKLENKRHDIKKIKEESDARNRYAEQLEKEKRAKLEERNNINSDENDGDKVRTYIGIDDKWKEGLSEDKRSKIEELDETGREQFGRFTRKMHEISGNLNEESDRITLKEAKRIIESEDFIEAIKEIEGINQYADFEGGSGGTIKEYWLNDEGTEILVAIMEQEQVFYEKRDGEFGRGFFEELTE